MRVFPCFQQCDNSLWDLSRLAHTRSPSRSCPNHLQRSASVWARLGYHPDLASSFACNLWLLHYKIYQSILGELQRQNTQMPWTGNLSHHFLVYWDLVASAAHPHNNVMWHHLQNYRVCKHLYYLKDHNNIMYNSLRW